MPAKIMEPIICYFYKGHGGAYQAAKIIAAKIIKTLYMSDFKKDVRFFIASCLACGRYLRL